VAAFVALGLGASAPAADPLEAFGQRLQAAVTRIQAGKCEPQTWRSLQADPEFPKAPSTMRSIIYVGLAACVGGPETHDWIRKATDEKDVLPSAWGLRFADDVDRKDTADALHALEASAEQAGWTHVETYTDRALFGFWRNLRTEPEAKRRLLTLLDRVRWKPSEPVGDASAIWSDLALSLAQEGKAAEAAHVAERITLPSVLFSMRLDKRLDPVVQANPQAFDVEYAAFATLQQHQRAYALAPEHDELAYEIIQDLRLLNRLDEALAVADATLAKKDVKDNEGRDYRHWIEDRRAMVLNDLGRFDEALALERHAAERQEGGSPNVSNRINLAGFLNGVGRHDEALATLAPFDKPGLSASIYGEMWVNTERACAAAALGRDNIKAKALAFTAAHAADNRAARIKATLCANDLTGARQAFVDWLADPEARGEALLQLSEFAPVKMPPYDAEIARRFAAVRKDPALLDAIAKVGRTETSKLSGSTWIDFL
jgi:hypothetical protein